MKRVRISKGAARELEEATLWYERESPGLGKRLIGAFEHAVEVLGGEMPPLLATDGEASAKGAKRIILHRFPFSVVVIERSDEYVIVALAHHSRRPGYWKDRART